MADDRTLTQYTKDLTSINAITFEVQESDTRKKLANWTHGQSNSQTQNLAPDWTGTSLTLPMYPQEIMRTQPVMADVLPTITTGDALQPTSNVNLWGMSTPRWSLRGHTGWRRRELKPGLEIDGYMAYVALFNFFENFFKENMSRMRDTTNNKPLVKMLFYNWADGFQDWWYVMPQALPSKTRSHTNPLLYNYEITLIGVNAYTDTAKVVDDITKLISDYNIRTEKVKASITSSMSSFSASIDSALKSIGMSLPPSLAADIDRMGSNMSGLTSSLGNPTMSLDYFKTVGSQISTTLVSVQTVKTGLTNAIVNQPLSEAYNCIHSLNNIICGLTSLGSFNLSAYSTLTAEWNELMSNIQGSGCGTSLR